jgi:hypothetical protein
VSSGTVEVLKRARGHISDPAMWHKGSLFADDSDGPCCALGAWVWAGHQFGDGDLAVVGCMRGSSELLRHEESRAPAGLSPHG